MNETDDDNADGRLEQGTRVAAVEEPAAVDSGSSVLFFARPPMELLRHFHEGDPLRILHRGAVRLVETGIMMCEGRLFSRSVARAAYDGCHYDGELPLDAWLSNCVDRSIADLLEEDRREDRRNAAIEDERYYRLLVDLLDVSAPIARSMFVVFNDLPEPVRRAYLGFARENKTMGDVAEEMGLTDAEVRGHVMAVLRTVLALKGEDA